MRSKSAASRVAVSGVLLAVLAGGAALAAPLASMEPPLASSQDSSPRSGQDLELKDEVQKQLHGKNFKDITVRVSEGIVTLSGQVNLYAYKVKAVEKARKARGVDHVRDNIAVGGPTIPDNVLGQKLNDKIQVDRIGFGQAFDAISVAVQNGVVTLGGHAKGPVTEQSAVGLAQYMPGVKGVVNKIQIDPVSPYDDEIRLAAFRAIYGYGPLQQYAIVPSRPIRISVQNGNLTLYGVVDNAMDKELVYMRVMQLPNIFHVTNDLIVANQPNEKKTNQVSSSSQQ
ncbi:MAG TPA: BON domain-containing protein [Acidobacteriaceae bacterium]|nr:BON domain-containing protein [Acidobacteriaceae bacterium]